jgi:hypothetical protein
MKSYFCIMKKIITLLIVLYSHMSYGQYSGLTIIPQERSFICSFENVNDNNFGFYIGAVHRIPHIYRTPYDCLNRIGITYGFLKCGLVAGVGIKTDLIAGPEPILYPDVMLKIQPIKLLTLKKNIWDVSVTFGIANTPYIGFGISNPYWCVNYYR